MNNYTCMTNREHFDYLLLYIREKIKFIKT